MSREEMLLHLVTHGGYHRGDRAHSGAVRHHAATRYPDHLLHRSEPGRRGDVPLAEGEARP